jgi:hypothetical protein
MPEPVGLVINSPYVITQFRQFGGTDSQLELLRQKCNINGQKTTVFHGFADLQVHLTSYPLYG